MCASVRCVVFSQAAIASPLIVLSSVGMALALPNTTAVPALLPSLQAQVPAPGRVTPGESEPFLQPVPLPTPLPPEPTPPLAPPVAPPPPAVPSEVDASQAFFVSQIEVIGSTVFEADDFAAIVQPYEGQAVTLEALQSLADQITQLYLDHGYITSRAILVDQVIASEGRVRIQVIEGTLEAIEVEGNQQVRDRYIRDRIALGGRAPLNQGRLEDQLRLLRLDPLFENVEASLRAGTGLGQSILSVRVTEAHAFYGSVGIDNLSPPSVGSERFGISLGYRSLTGSGDDLFAYYYRSTTGGANVYNLSYRFPVNPMEGTIEVRVAPSDFRVTSGSFANLDVEGSANLYELSFRQPLVRSPREEFALSLGLTYRDGETLVSGQQIDPGTTSVIRFGQDYVRRDPQGAWAGRSQFNIGTGLFDANTTVEPDGLFLSWLGQVQRVQILHPNHLLILQADVQLSLDALPASQQFVIGGGQSLRGYRQNARLGDSGFRLAAEDRIAIQRNEAGLPTLQLAPFMDMGAVWNSDDSRDLPDQTFLVGLGLGVLWTPLSQLDVRLDYGIPLVELSDRGTNAQDEGVYFSLNYRF